MKQVWVDRWNVIGEAEFLRVVRDFFHECLRPVTYVFYLFLFYLFYGSVVLANQ